MDERQLADLFDRERPRLRSVAYRILGSLTDSDDAVQEAWLRLQRSDVATIDNLQGWLTTVVARICLNMLRDRRSHGEQPLDAFVPEPIVSTDPHGDPEQEALLADSVGVALGVVLDALRPAERVAFVLHDMFAVPFDEIAALVAVLDPDVIVRSHTRTGLVELRGADRVARGAVAGRALAEFVSPALVNGAAGAVGFRDDRPFAILAFTVVGDRAVAIDVFNDPDLVPALVQTCGI